MFGVKVSEALEFVPLLHFESLTKMHTVLGEVILPEWGDASWPAVIREVPQVEVKAYWKNAWTVNPVGLTVPLRQTADGYENCMLCEIVDFEFVEEGQDEEEEGVGIDILIPGPQGRMMPKSQVYSLLSSGCVSCQDALDIEEMEEMQVVNDGSSLLCPACIEDFDRAEIVH